MKKIEIFAIYISSFSFFFFGLLCFFSPRLVVEFERYGLKNFRVFTGLLQVAGALGLFMGLKNRMILLLSSLGLSLLMFFAFVVRIQISDPIHLMLPSLLFAFLNLFIFIRMSMSKPIDDQI